MKDGHLGKCKECAKADVKKHRKENDSVREYDRARGNRQDADYLRKWRADNPKKYIAHIAVGVAVKQGWLVRPETCCECSSSFAVEGHHDDYDLPLQVRWLCAECHKRWHAANGEAKNS